MNAEKYTRLVICHPPAVVRRLDKAINLINHYPSDNEFFCYQLLDSYLPQRWIELFTLRTTGDILSELNH